MTIDPRTLLRVRVRQLDQSEISLTVVVCRYVPAFIGPLPSIAVELIYDPQNGAPNAPYYRQSEQLLPLLIAPDALLEIRPYWPPASSLGAAMSQ